MQTTPRAAFWDKLADSYSQKPVDDEAAWKRKQDFHKSLLRPDDAVLDVGCGTGSLCLLLAPHAREVHGIDFSGEMIRIARGKAAAQGAENTSFTQCTLDDFDRYEPESLDVVSAYSLLHLVDDPDATMRRLYALLKPGGYFVSSTSCLGNSWFPYRPMLAVMRWLGKAPPVSILRSGDMLARMAAAGFVDVREVDVGAAPIILYAVARKPA